MEVPAQQAALASAPQIPVGTGPVLNGTFLSFGISDRVSLKVNVGSGNALVTTSDITVPEIGSSLTLGSAYNSLLAGSGEPVGSNGYGWRQREGADVQLYPASDGTVTYLGEDGTAGTFSPSGSSGYTSPGQFHVTLVKSSADCGGTGWTMTWHATGEIMCFAASGLLTSESDRNGNTTAYSYDSSGQETQVTYTPQGASSPARTVTASYTGPYLTGLSQTASTAVKTVSYNVNASTGNLDSVTQPDGTEITFGYDPAHDLTSITNGDQATTTLGYDSSHRVTSVTQPTTGSGTATTRFDYTSSTQTLLADPDTSQSDPVSSVPHVTYTVDSPTSLITGVTDQQGNSRSTSYTPFDDVATYTNGVGGETANTYGANSGESLTKSQSPTGAATSWAYANQPSGSNPTANFQPSSSTDTQQNTTSYTYDGAGNLAQSTNALAAAAKVTYNANGTPATSTDPMNGSNPASYGYNAAGEVNHITPPTGNSLQPVTLTYDGFGRVHSVTDGDGNTVTYSYDKADRVTQAAYTGGPSTVTAGYTYDGAGNMISRTGQSGTTTWAYDGRNLVTSRTASSGGGTLSYGYGKDANLTSVTDAAGTTSYLYNSRNLMYQMTDPAGHVWEFAYDADGRRTTTWFNTNSNESTWASKMLTSYDTTGRITRIQADENSSPSNAVFDTSYCYSPYVSGQSCPSASASTDTGLVQYSTANTSGTTSVYSYDKANRLTKATNVNGTTYSYGYDSDGNLTSQAGCSGCSPTLTYNSANQITNSGYAYDGAGNKTADPVIGTLSYNDAEQLTNTSDPYGNGPETFTYAGDTQTEMLSDGSASNVVYGLAGQDGQPWVQSYNGIEVLRDQQGTPLGMETNGHVYSFITDNLGSVIKAVDTTGSTADSYSYDPYGNTPGSPSAIGNLLGYTGALTDAAQNIYTGIASRYIHLGQRWYNPFTSRFTTQDSISILGDPTNGNRYAYAAANPINNTDPNGQCSVTSGAGIGSEIGTVAGGIGGSLVGGLASGGIGAVPGFFVGAGEGATAGTIIGGAICGIGELF